MRRKFDLFTSLLPQSYLSLALRWWWLVLLCAILAASAALTVSLNMRPIYRATSQVLINQARSPTGDNYSDLLLSERLASTYARLMARDSTLVEALVQLGLEIDQPSDLIADVRVTPIRDTQLIELTVEGSNPEIVAAVANILPAIFEQELQTVQSKRYSDSKASLSTQLDALSRQIEQTQIGIAALGEARTAQEELEYARLTNLLAQYQASYSDVLQNFEDVRLAEAQSIDSIVIMQPAEVPEAPIRPRTKVNVLLAAIVGTMLALGTVFLVEFLDDRVRSSEDLARITDLPVIGALPTVETENSEEFSPAVLISVTQPRHPSVEAYRRLRTNLQFFDVDRQLHSLAITSANAQEGKSLTGANLAVVMARSDLSVIIVDCDLRKPRQHRLFGLSRSPGIADAILADDVVPCLRQPRMDVPNLQILTAGESVPFPAEVLGSERMHEIIHRLGEMADILIIDTPPVLAVTDAQVVGRLVDGTILVIDTQKTTGTAVRHSLEALLQVNIPMVGAVLNRLSRRTSRYYYYDYYEYTDAEDGDGNGKRRRKQARGEVHPAVQPSQASD